METKVRETLARLPGQARPWVARFWLDAALFALAALCMAAGTCLWAQPEWTRRTDIADFNKGITAYAAPPARGTSSLEKARRYLEKALDGSDDAALRALALYNLGTMAGQDALKDIRAVRQAYAAEGRQEDPSNVTLAAARRQVQEAISRLAEAVRLDPSLDDAKFNLELLAREPAEQETSGQRYAPGEVDKGY